MEKDGVEDYINQLTFAAAFSAFFFAAASAFSNFLRAFLDRGCPFSSNRTSAIAAVAPSTALSAMVQNDLWRVMVNERKRFCRHGQTEKRKEKFKF